MNIVADQDLPLVSRLFSSLGDIRLVPGREIDSRILRDCDLLLARSVTKIDGALLRDAAVRYIGSATSGVDHVDQSYLRERGIAFVHAPGCNAQSVCEYVLSALFCLQDQSSFSLEKKHVGIVGHGHIGSLLARYLRVLGCEVSVYDPLLRDAAGEYPYRDPSPVLAADIVTLHAALSDDGPYPSRGMVNADWFSRLRDDAVFINSARGGLAQEAALRDFLEDNPAARAALDVWADEPRIDLALLRRAAIATPHIAGYSLEAKYRAVGMVYRGLAEVLKSDGAANLPELSTAPEGKSPALKLDLADDAEAVKMAALSAYDVRGDSAALRALPQLEADKRAEFFDSLRADYPLRREFSHLRLLLPPGRPALREKLLALGFAVKDEPRGTRPTPQADSREMGVRPA